LFYRPKTTTTHLEPESLDNSEIDHDKIYLKPNQKLNATSPKESKPVIYSVLYNAKIPAKTPLLKYNSYLSLKSNTARQIDQQNLLTISSKNALNCGNKQVSNFIPISDEKLKKV